MSEFKAAWDKLKTAGAAASAESFAGAGDEFLGELLGLPAGEGLGSLPAHAEPKRQRCRRLLGAMMSGQIVAVGTLPQLEMAMAAGFAFVALGRRALVLSPISVEPDWVRQLLRFGADRLGIKSVFVDRACRQPAWTEAMAADLVCCDYLPLLAACQGAPSLLERRPTAAIFCEADLALFDNRLAVFVDGRLQACGAVFHSVGKPLPAAPGGVLLDSREVLSRLDLVCGVAGTLTRNLARELSDGYGATLRGVVADPRARPPEALIFRTVREKLAALCDRIVTADRDVLVFHCLDETRDGLARELRQRGQHWSFLRAPGDLRKFLAEQADQKQVGFYGGLPTVLSSPPRTRRPVTTLVAEHFLFPHHHAKVRNFAERETEIATEPVLYVAAEEELLGHPLQMGRVAQLFDFVALTEILDERRRVRRIMARAVLAKVERFLRSALTEETPVFSAVVLPSAEPLRADRIKLEMTRILDGPCFCGSNRPFRQCHGQVKGQGAGQPG